MLATFPAELIASNSLIRDIAPVSVQVLMTLGVTHFPAMIIPGIKKSSRNKSFDIVYAASKRRYD